MKKTAIYAPLLLVGIGATMLLSGCASTHIRHMDAEAFIERARVIEQINSAMWMSYVGTSQGRRAYLEYQDLLTLSGKPKTVVYWTELDGLPDELAARLIAGNPPWVPWQLATNKTPRTIEVIVPE